MPTFLQDLGITREILSTAAVVLAVFIVSLAVSWYRRRKKIKEKEQHALRRMREEALDRALANPMGEEQAEPFEKMRRPFRVEYSQGDHGQEGGGSQGGMYQLTEITELSQRTYMFRCQEQTFIGEQFGTVTILPGTADPSQVQCEIFYYKKENYIKSTGKLEVLLKRKGKQAIVGLNGLKLHSGDRFYVGKASFQIDFLK
ncbi:MAG: hypothetical protein LIP16_13200 [Clostridium sp.]|nr:hypothetical protein [Clostridium sp.]